MWVGYIDIQKVGNKSVRTYEDGSTEEIEIPEEIRNEPGLRMVAPIVELLGSLNWSGKSLFKCTPFALYRDPFSKPSAFMDGMMKISVGPLIYLRMELLIQEMHTQSLL